MSEAKVRGIVHLIEPTKTYGKNDFRKRLVVLEQDKGRFTNYVPVEFIHEGCDSVDGLNVGDDVEVTYRLSGRKWQKDANSDVKFFLNAEALSFRLAGDESSEASGSGGSFDENEFGGDEEDDGIPF